MRIKKEGLGKSRDKKRTRTLVGRFQLLLKRVGNKNNTGQREKGGKQLRGGPPAKEVETRLGLRKVIVGVAEGGTGKSPAFPRGKKTGKRTLLHRDSRREGLLPRTKKGLIRSTIQDGERHLWKQKSHRSNTIPIGKTLKKGTDTTIVCRGDSFFVEIKKVSGGRKNVGIAPFECPREKTGKQKMIQRPPKKKKKNQREKNTPTLGCSPTIIGGEKGGGGVLSLLLRGELQTCPRKKTINIQKPTQY